MTFDVHAIVSGGFATDHPNNKLTINAVEAAPLADFSLEVSTLILQPLLGMLKSDNYVSKKRLFVLTLLKLKKLQPATVRRRIRLRLRLRLAFMTLYNTPCRSKLIRLLDIPTTCFLKFTV